MVRYGLPVFYVLAKPTFLYCMTKFNYFHVPINYYGQITCVKVLCKFLTV